MAKKAKSGQPKMTGGSGGPMIPGQCGPPPGMSGPPNGTTNGQKAGKHAGKKK